MEVLRSGVARREGRRGSGHAAEVAAMGAVSVGGNSSEGREVEGADEGRRERGGWRAVSMRRRRVRRGGEERVSAWRAPFRAQVMWKELGASDRGSTMAQGDTMSRGMAGKRQVNDLVRLPSSAGALPKAGVGTWGLGDDDVARRRSVWGRNLVHKSLKSDRYNGAAKFDATVPDKPSNTSKHRLERLDCNNNIAHAQNHQSSSSSLADMAACRCRSASASPPAMLPPAAAGAAGAAPSLAEYPLSRAAAPGAGAGFRDTGRPDAAGGGAGLALVAVPFVATGGGGGAARAEGGATGGAGLVMYSSRYADGAQPDAAPCCRLTSHHPASISIDAPKCLATHSPHSPLVSFCVTMTISSFCRLSSPEL